MTAGGRLSSPLASMRPYYDVVVVGSGYGGAVAAARLARPGVSVCVLERGEELRPGDYPDTLPAAIRQFQVDLPGRHLFSRSALYDLRLNGDMSVFVGCGLGGTSLINANVAFEPDKALFAMDAWPRAIRHEAADGTLATYFHHARKMLQPAEFPCDEPPLKFRALERLAKVPQTWGGAATRVPVTVLFPAHANDEGFRVNRFGVRQHPCTGCGDCVSGCNYGAKNTLLMNYLPEARQRGASIFTSAQVDSIERGASGWIVHWRHLRSGRHRFDHALLRLRAGSVILAAGTLGSTEILLRSRDDRGLSVSETLGSRFSGNGDMLAFAYNGRVAVNAIGFGPRSPHGFDAPGPCITGAVPLGGAGGGLLQEGVIPGALAPVLSLGFIALAVLKGKRASTGQRGSILRLLEDYARGGVAATQTFLVMMRDERFGRLVLKDDRIRVEWPGAGGGDMYDEVTRKLRKGCGPADATYLPSPFGAVTVHPLGGCPMADDPARGVVTDIGAVFTGNHSNGSPEIHPGLYVCDGSILPCALGVNPLLTITALAERASHHIAAGRR
jgi:cholesterol oxidase